MAKTRSPKTLWSDVMIWKLEVHPHYYELVFTVTVNYDAKGPASVRCGIEWRNMVNGETEDLCRFALHPPQNPPSGTEKRIPAPDWFLQDADDLIRGPHDSLAGTGALAFFESEVLEWGRGQGYGARGCTIVFSIGARIRSEPCAFLVVKSATETIGALFVGLDPEYPGMEYSSFGAWGVRHSGDKH